MPTPPETKHTPDAMRAMQRDIPRHRASRTPSQKRAADCLNALVGISDPVAYMEAMRGLMDAAQRACSELAVGHAHQSDSAVPAEWESEYARNAYFALRAAIAKVTGARP